MLAAALTFSILTSSLRAPEPLSARNASYRIAARLDTVAHTVSGTSTLTWRNDAAGPAEALVFHLYMNAFKNEQSAFFTERGPSAKPPLERGKWGAIDVASVSVTRTDGGVRAATLEVPPVGDQTLGTLRLEHPVAPGETIEVAVKFVTRLPEIVARAGHKDGFYAVTQWFPKVGVFACDPECSWRASPYHANAEFFADFGGYDVTLDVPDVMTVGATGTLQEDQRAQGRRILRYVADDVHDFAWTADAAFEPSESLVDDGSGLPPVHVILISRASLRAHATRHLAAVRAGLTEMAARLGPYPYAALTVVQVPHGAQEAGGMEYPTLFFTDDEPVLPDMLAPELVTAHELAHQWFQGILASDEAGEPWLDEGLAELATGWILARLAPSSARVYRTFGHELTYVGLEQALLGEEQSDPVARASHAFRDGSAYAELVYRKPSLVLETLAARLGEAEVTRMLRTYYARHRFKHPRTADFVAAFADAPGPMRALLDSALHVPGRLDYAITAIRSEPDRTPAGLFEGGAERTTAPGSGHRNELIVERIGSQRIPVTVEALFADGHTERATIADDDASWHRLRFDGPSPIVEGRLHPDRETPIDTVRWNDGLRVRPDTQPRRRLMDSARVWIALLVGWLGR
jgi:hypothetical protein